MKYLLIILFTIVFPESFTQSATNIFPHKPSDALEKILVQRMYDFSNAWRKVILQH